MTLKGICRFDSCLRYQAAVAQRIRAPGSYPGCRRFESYRRYQKITLPHQDALADRALFNNNDWHLIKALIVVMRNNNKHLAPVAQLDRAPAFEAGQLRVRVLSGVPWGISSAVRALGLHPRSQEFESSIPHHAAVAQRQSTRLICGRLRVQFLPAVPWGRSSKAEQATFNRQGAGSSPAGPST